MKAREADRAFAKSVGMEFGTCEMCDLLTIETRRSAETVRVLHRGIEARDRLIRRHKKKMGTLKLACFSATLMMLLFAWATIAGR